MFTTLINRLLEWKKKPIDHNDWFGTQIHKTIQAFCDHEWEFRTVIGEEEHGLDPSKRFCIKCGKCQRAWYHKYGDIRISWKNCNEL
jgi:hypothetical protein